MSTNHDALKTAFDTYLAENEKFTKQLEFFTLRC
jgi:hypothetical protein